MPDKYDDTPIQEKQLKLFEIEKAEEYDRYSRTIEVYDSMPKYHWGRQSNKSGKEPISLNALERNFEFRGTEYTCVVIPGKVKDKDGIYRDYYPGKREELVEDAIRKLFCRDNDLITDEKQKQRFGLCFTLHELQKELADNGHTYSKTELRRAIDTCASTIISVIPVDGRKKDLRQSPIFPYIKITSERRKKGQKVDPDAKVCVTFHTLVAESINAVTFRTIDYDQSMRLRRVMSRYLYKKMSHVFTGASYRMPYGPKLTTVLRNTGITPMKRFRDHIKEAEKAIQELIDQDIVMPNSTLHPIIEKRSIVDADFELYPTPKFVQYIKRMNQLQPNLK